MQKEFKTSIQIKPSDIDLNGHLHYPKYLEYIIFARYDQMKNSYKFSMERFFKLGFSWVVKRLKLDYVSPIFIQDNIFVCTRILEMNGSDCEIEINIKKNNDVLCLKGNIIFTLVDFKTGKSAEIPEKIKEHFLSFEEQAIE